MGKMTSKSKGGNTTPQPKNLKLLKTPFIDVSNYTDEFLKTDLDLNIFVHPELSACKSTYMELLSEFKETLTKLMDMETLIVQMRCKETIRDNIKFSLNKEYIYARATFYRPGMSQKDIRVFMGKYNGIKDDFEDLYSDPHFLGTAIHKLEQAMDTQIELGLIRGEHIMKELQTF